MKILSFILSMVLTLYAAPAFQQKKLFRQSDGSSFYGYVKGDEYLHYIQTENGDIVIYNPKTNNFDYATIVNDRLTPSGTPYMKKSLHTLTHRSMQKRVTQRDLQQLRQKALKRFRHH